MSSFNFGGALAALAPTLTGLGVSPVLTGIAGAVAAGFSPGAPVGAVPAIVRTIQAAAPGVTDAPEGVSMGLGEKFIKVAGKALAAYRSFEALPVQNVDVISLGQADDRELAKLLISRGVIPADSDLGRGAQLAGAKPFSMSVQFSDGTSEKMQVIRIGGKGGGRGRRGYYYTPRRGRIAAKIMRAGLREIKQLRTLGMASSALQRATHPHAPRIAAKAGKRR